MLTARHFQAGGYDLGQARGFRPIRIVEGAFVLQTTDEPPAMFVSLIPTM